jgi:hypothetical protein
VPKRTSSRLLAAVLALLLSVGVACGNDDNRPSLAEPDTQPSTAETATPVTLDPDANIVATAKNPGELPVYDQPGAAEPFTSLANPTSYGAPLTFLVKDKTNLGEWINVYLPIRPNGSTGYVKAADVILSPHDWRIEVRLGEFNLKVYEGEELFLDAPIAIAKDNTPTPGGLYYTTELLQPPDPNGAYGTYAYGLSGFSDVLTSFNGGPGQLGIHGTNQPELIGTQVSSGCIRLRNEDIDQLAPVLPLGVPVEIIT